MRRPYLTVAGVLAALGFIAKGLLEPPGGAYYLIAAAILAAVALRQSRFRG